MIKYKVKRYWPYITEVEATRETEKTVWIKNDKYKVTDRHAKRSEYTSFFDTIEEAQTFLIEHFKSKKSSLENAIHRIDIVLEKELTEAITKNKDKK